VIERISAVRADARGESNELRRIRQRLAEVATGRGGVLYIEGARGSGKTGLVVGTIEAARAAGMRVLDAQGRALEREFPFGVAIQAFEETWLATTSSERTILFDGPARPAGELMSGAPPVAPALAGDHAYAVIHGLFCLARALTVNGADGGPGGPLALVVDDVDRADDPSLRLLAYLAPRIDDLPIAIIVAACSDPPGADSPVLSALRGASQIVELAPPAGSPRGTVEGPRTAAARMALGKSLAEGHRESVSDLAELAWGGGAMLESNEDADGWPAVASSLLFVDELERAVEIAQTAMRPASGAGNGRVVGRAIEGWGLFHQGLVTAALAVAQAALAVRRDDRAARGLIGACYLAQGRLAEAESALTMLSDTQEIEAIDASVLLDLRAQLHLARIRPADALTEALEAGHRGRGSVGPIGPGVVAWRSTAALAHLALGDTRRARALAEEELELARVRGLTRVVIRDLRILAFAAKGARSLDLLAEAVRIGRAAPPRFEFINALVDLGAATRRANQRRAARHPLRKGLELAERGGATALARRASEELGATGARSRGVMLSGVRALTPSERRVADLAANGLTTRQIAQVLFVTPKTVEFHLRHVYRKLDIPSSRAELARAMSVAVAG
jgi:DNA-binding CsgD family transcriptional regulator